MENHNEGEFEMQIKKIIPEADRPRCEVDGCNRSGQHKGTYRKDGTPLFRKKCSQHHFIDHGIGGWDYKIHRKTYCENVDGRLGFVCTSNIIDHEWQIDVDHRDGNPSNNNPENLQSLCKCCHAIKTKNERDYMTPGRKSLKKVA